MYFESASGDTIQLTYNNILKDGSISVTAKVYSGATQVGSDETLTHVADGLYRVSYVVPSGYDNLIVYFIPSGSDNATSVSQIKIRSLTPFGSAGGMFSSGLTENDLRLLADELKKFNVWKVKLSSGRTAEQELIAKSEFDHTQDMVKVPEIKIPIVDFSDVKNFISRKIDEISDVSDNKIIITTLNSIQKALKDKKVDIDFSEIRDALKVLMESKSMEHEKNHKEVCAILYDIYNSLPKDNSESIIKGLLPEIVSVSTKIQSMEKIMSLFSELNSLKKQLNELTSVLESNKELIFNMDDLEQKRAEDLLSKINDLFEQVFKELRLMKNVGGLEKAFKDMSKNLMMANERV